MDHILPPELFWLTMVTLVTALMWIPYITNWILEQGPVEALWKPGNYDHSKPAAKWARRMLRAHENAVENLVVFATLVLTLNALQVSTPLTVAACTVYFWARLAHFASFTLSIPGMRVLTFLTGFGAQVILVKAILG